MRIYVAGPIADIAGVRAVQDAVVAAGHRLTLDWTRGADVTFTDGYGSDPALSAGVASADLDGVMDADAVLLVVSEHEGRGMYVELGAALARARDGRLDHVVVVGRIHHDSVFLHHPVVQRVSTAEEWLTSVS